MQPERRAPHKEDTDLCIQTRLLLAGRKPLKYTSKSIINISAISFSVSVSQSHELTIYQHNVQSRSHIVDDLTHDAVQIPVKLSITRKALFSSSLNAVIMNEHIRFTIKTDFWPDNISCSTPDIYSKMGGWTDSGEAALWLTCRCS